MQTAEPKSIEDLYFGLQTHVENITAALALPPETPAMARAKYIVDEARRLNCIAQAIENKLRANL